jgi:glutathione peroxidase
MTIYDFNVLDYQGNDVSLSEYKGKLLLVVNTATGCGFTPQYKGLEELYKKYNPQGFEILDFPCNQFANQAKGSDQDIHQFCTLKYQTTFRQFKKIEVNGKNEAPLYTYLKDAKRGLCGSKKIKWNFTKFLISEDGKVLKRYSPQTKPEKIEKDIINYYRNK